MLNLLNEQYQVYYNDTILYLLPTIFGSYLIYDVIKHLEYKKKRGRKDILYRLEITLVFLGIFVALAGIFYSIEVIKVLPSFNLGNTDVTRSVFILFSIIAVVFYRYRKWHIRGNPKLDVS